MNPNTDDLLDPVDLDLGDFDGDGDADIAVAFATTDIQGLPQGVVRLLRVRLGRQWKRDFRGHSASGVGFTDRSHPRWRF